MVKIMINACIVCVCYNTYSELLDYLLSIENSLSLSPNLKLKILICDNSSIIDNQIILKLQKSKLSISYFKNLNIGYFPSVELIMKNFCIDTTKFDYIIISNTDIVLDQNFFLELTKNKKNKKIGALAPQIFSIKSKIFLNPSRIKRPSKIYLTILKNIFKNQLLYNIFILLHLAKKCLIKKFPQNNVFDEIHFKNIYSAHGSIIIFTKQFFIQGGLINYPRFLFGEEIFVAEEIRKISLLISYTPNIKVYDKEHASTSSVKRKLLLLEQVKSLNYLIQKYF
ncbi:MAG: hypothetical protein V1816_27635 [Pseudomonadota bacterium]